VLAVAAALARPAAAEDFADALIAVVNNEVITFYDVSIQTQFYDRLQRNRILAADDITDKLAAFDAAVREHRMAAVQRLIDELAVYAEFTGKGYKIPDELVTRRLDQIVASETAGDWVKFEELLTTNRMTMTELRDRIRKTFAVEAYVSQEIDQRINLSPKAVFDHYESHRENYREPAEVRLQMIVLVPGKATAQEFQQRVDQVAAKVAENGDFVAVAQQHSDSPLKAKADDVGWLKATAIAPEFRQSFAALRSGEVAGPVRKEGNVFLLRIAEARGGDVQPFAVVRDQVRSELFRAERQRRYQELIERLRARVVIRRLGY
jgi:parvulin-like peptidyl-prolyl isomerase